MLLVGAASESTPKLPDSACSRMAFSWFSRRTAVTAFLYGSLILGMSSCSKTGAHFFCSPSARYIFYLLKWLLKITNYYVSSVFQHRNLLKRQFLQRVLLTHCFQLLLSMAVVCPQSLGSSFLL